ncbi:glutamine amidotransferase [Aminobacter sp. Piv2-1]|uniref:glutamine amidotransferase n=1 Tax=Aminobacter sp. Piv2-1 TaxID=3031122 RepID=UPI003095892F
MHVLLAGETFSAITSVAAGSNVVTSSTWSNGATAFITALSAAGHTVTQIGGDRCSTEFPTDLDTLQSYATVILSDVSALTLLLTPEARAGRVSVNRLELLKTYVERGGGLLMAGGYMSFQGMFGNAHFYNTAIEDILPIRCSPWADGIEVPEGAYASIGLPTHPLVAGLDLSWPPILGLNKVDFRQDGSSRLIATARCRGHDLPLLATREYANGRSAAWMTDIGPHWLSEEFLQSQVYARLMANIIRWLSKAT